MMWIAIRPMARDNDHARDLVHDSWLCIFGRLDQYAGRGSFANWAVKVARNHSRMQLRKEKRAAAVEIPLQKHHHEVEDDAPGPEEQAMWALGREKVYRALDRLPDRERNALALWLLEGKETPQIAEALDVTKESARAIVDRGMARLKRMALKGELFSDPS